MIKNALLSVSDKTGIVDFAKGLVELGEPFIPQVGPLRLLLMQALQQKRLRL